MRIKNIFFRYGVSNVYMIVVMLLAFVAMFKGMDIYNQLQAGIEDKERYAYANECTFGIAADNSGKFDISSVAKGVESNLYIDHTCVIDKEGEAYRMKVYLNTDKIKESFIEGGMPDKSAISSNTPAVVIGQNFKKYTYMDGGKRYISINGTHYLVSGIVGSRYSDYLDNSVITLYDTLPEAEKNIILSSYYYTLVLQSDGKIAGDYDKIYENVANLKNCSVSDYQAEKNTVHNSDGTDKIYFLMYIFCMVNCVIAAEFFAYERQEEIAVRKTYGFSTAGIFAVVFKDVLKLAALSAVLGLLINFLINMASHSLEGAIRTLSLQYLGMALVMVVFSAFVIIFIPIIKTARSVAVKTLG